MKLKELKEELALALSGEVSVNASSRWLIVNHSDRAVDIKLEHDILQITWFVRDPYKQVKEVYERVTTTQWMKLRDMIKDKIDDSLLSVR